MKIIEISEAAAKQAYLQADDTLRPVLVTLLGADVATDDRPVTERINSWADVLAYHTLTAEDFNEWCAGLSDDEIGYRKSKLTVKALNEGWTPDWTDGTQAKYYPLMEHTGSGFRFYTYGYYYQYSTVGSRLCFKSSALAIHYGKQFAGIINEFFL